MTTVQDILNLALVNTHTNSNQIAAANLLIYFNHIRNYIRRKINTDLNERFFYEMWKTDAVANRANGEYRFPVATPSQAGMDKLIKVSVKYKDETFYRPCSEISINEFEARWDERLINQPKTNPVYYVADESYFLAPNFTADDLDAVSGNYQIKVEGIKKFIDLTAADTIDKILLPYDFYETIALGMEQFIYKARGLTALKDESKNDFIYELDNAISDLAGRDISEMTASLPNTDHLE